MVNEERAVNDGLWNACKRRPSSVLQLLIDGEFVDSSSGKTFDTEDPRTGEVLVEVAEAQEEDVDRAVQAARRVCTLLMLSYCLYMLRPALRTLGDAELCSLRVVMSGPCEAPRALTSPGTAGI